MPAHGGRPRFGPVGQICVCGQILAPRRRALRVCRYMRRGHSRRAGTAVRAGGRAIRIGRSAAGCKRAQVRVPLYGAQYARRAWARFRPKQKNAKRKVRPLGTGLPSWRAVMGAVAGLRAVCPALRRRLCNYYIRHRRPLSTRRRAALKIQRRRRGGEGAGAPCEKGAAAGDRGSAGEEEARRAPESGAPEGAPGRFGRASCGGGTKKRTHENACAWFTGRAWRARPRWFPGRSGSCPALSGTWFRPPYQTKFCGCG